MIKFISYVWRAWWYPFSSKIIVITFWPPEIQSAYHKKSNQPYPICVTASGRIRKRCCRRSSRPRSCCSEPGARCRPHATASSFPRSSGSIARRRSRRRLLLHLIADETIRTRTSTDGRPRTRCDALGGLFGSWGDFFFLSFEASRAFWGYVFSSEPVVHWRERFGVWIRFEQVVGIIWYILFDYLSD